MAPDRDLGSELCNVLEKETKKSFKVIMRVLSFLSEQKFRLLKVLVVPRIHIPWRT